MDKRQHILDTALTLFNQSGYHSVGIDSIILAAGVAKKTCYRYFPSKSDLICEVLEQRLEACQISLTAFVMPAHTPMARLERVFDWHAEWFLHPDFFGCMFALAAAEFPDRTSRMHIISARQKRGLIAFVRDLLVPLCSHQRAEQLAPILVMLLDGATLAEKILGEKNSAQEAWKIAAQLLTEPCG
ncbi:TetR/AcrR family transcriptional regulator [Pseudomonas abieticivorans]|uniref:TetR/AcrR family transcriptional regulator n=1 Tax=Pseudomonas abieticivorans TaxID=2931382 RepID=UPI0020BDAF0E|nr:TetR/AcrR family transcriptional regulator [Pseudomonas sp. PIA16]